MSKQPDKQDLANAYITCVTRHHGPDYGGYTLRRLRLTQQQIDAATVAVEEPEVPGIVAAQIEMGLGRFVGRPE